MRPTIIGIYASDMRSGKSTVASNLEALLPGKRCGFAYPFYNYVMDIAAQFVPGGHTEVNEWLNDTRKDSAIIPELGVTLRSMLQTIGTNWGRGFVHPQLWTLLGEKHALSVLKNESAIFDDMRFPNEFDMIKRNGGKCIRVHRPGTGSRGDTSIAEGLLDGYEFDAVIDNSGTIEDLRSQVEDMVHRWHNQ